MQNTEPLLLMRKLKLIWDFHSPEALKIAEHHEIHLKEYISAQNFNIDTTGVESLSELHAIAFLVVNEDKMKLLRDVLKPHRGQVYTN